MWAADHGHDSKDGGKNDGGGDGGDGGDGGGGAPAVKIAVEDKSCTLAGECKEEKTYECEGCTLKAVKCNDAAADAAKVVIDAENKKIVFDFKAFADTDSCVYMGEFDINGNAHSQPVAVIDTKDVTLEKQKKNAKEGEAVEETITFTGEKKTEVQEVRVNGLAVEKKGDKADVPSYEVDEEKKTIKISVPKLSAEYAGHYQVKFKVEEAEVTKTILEVEMEAGSSAAKTAGDGGGAGGCKRSFCYLYFSRTLFWCL
ncbi:uncharacterized protein LOC134677345 [Cydia fagiglandana]|uniref:uncharacterized protein LOC134677345 n=1 Tax=Cydia fagiglandana TaxID=1458189 RepID=UPI002FEE2BE2